MVKTFYIIPILLFFCFYGALLTFAPRKSLEAEVKIYRFIKGVKAKKVRLPDSGSRIWIRRFAGFIYLAASLTILLNCRFQTAFIPEQTFRESVKKQADSLNDADIHARINDIVLPLMLKKGHVGMAVSTIINGKTDISCFGYADIQSSISVDRRTIFEIGSLSKLFTGILLSRLIETGKVGLDDSVLTFLGADIKDNVIKEKDLKNRITLKHLATHTSGLPRMPLHFLTPYSIFINLTAGDSYKHYSAEKIINSFYQCGLKHPPGERFGYSNLGYGLLGLILSRHRGTTYRDLVKNEICLPLGMNDTDVSPDKNQVSRLAAGYRGCFRSGPFNIAQLAENWTFPNAVAGAGGIRSTAEDMLHFLSASMGRGTSPLNSAIKASQKILFTGEKRRIGMGWLHREMPGVDTEILWHNGGTGGYASFLGFSGDGRAGVVILSNTAKNVDAIGFRILENFLSS